MILTPNLIALICKGLSVNEWNVFLSVTFPSIKNVFFNDAHKLFNFIIVFSSYLCKFNSKHMKEKKITVVLFAFLFMLSGWNANAQYFKMSPEGLDGNPSESHYDQAGSSNHNYDPEKVKQWYKAFMSGRADKIVGGEDVAIEDYPWQVSLQLTPGYGGGHFCGGTIIYDQWILTASHCLLWDTDDGDVELTPDMVRVGAGFTAMDNPSQGDYYTVEEIILHPEYTTSANRFDIALIKLADEIDFDHPGKAPVGMVSQEDADNGETDQGVMTKVSGWGALYSEGPSPNILQAIEVPIITSGTNYPPSYITPDMIMAGASGQDACQGDSGGPMVIDDGAGWYKVAGVVSWGVGCGSPGYPGVYARVSYFEDWLAEHLIFPDPNQYTTFFHEEFDGEIPTEWESVSIEGNKNFTWTDDTEDYGGYANTTFASPTAENGFAIFDNLNGTNIGPNPAEAALVSPALDFSQGEEFIIDFFHLGRHLGQEFDSAYPNLILKLEASTDDFDTDVQELWSLEFPDNEHYEESGNISVNADILAGEDNVKLRFRYIGGGGYWWLIDDVRISVENPALDVQFVVTDGEEPLADALVETGYHEQEAVTNNDGIAHLDLYEGNYTISVEKSGYFPYAADITVTEDGQVVNVELEKIPAPEIEIDLTAIEVDVKQGSMGNSVLNISNPGDAELEFSLAAFPSQTPDKLSLNQEPTARYQGYENTTYELQSQPLNGTAGATDSEKNKNTSSFDEVVEIHHDDDSSDSNGIGAGASSWITAVRFDAEDMNPYAGFYKLSQVKFHLGSNTFTEVEVKIWEGGSSAGPQTEIYSQVVTDDVNAQSWNIHELPEKIELEPGLEYWIGYAITSTGQYPSSTDSGPMVEGKGCWIYINDSWALLPDLNEDLDYNWRIRGVLEVEQLDWITMDPQTGTVAPDADEDIQLAFDGSSFELGTYSAQLLVQNNASPVVVIPVTMNVVPAEYDVTFDVKDPDGNVIDNAVVTLETITHAEGDYLFEDILVGEYAYSVTADGYNDAAGLIMVEEDMTVEVIMIPDDAEQVELTITIEDEFGELLPDVLFTLNGFGGHYTNAAGEVVLNIIPGTFNYQAAQTGFETENGEVVVTTDANQALDITMTYLRFNVEVTSIPPDGGIVSGEGEYYYGETVAIDALANDGYTFVHWLENDLVVSDDAQFSFDIDNDRDFEAVFLINTYTIDASAGNNGDISPEGEIIVEHGEDITFDITPDTGYDIEDVLVNGESIGAVASYTFENVTEDATIHAEFSIRTYEVNITSEGNGTITPDGIMTVDHGSSITFELEPEEGHHVGDLLINDNSVGWHYTYTLVNIEDDTDVHAVFAVGVNVDELDGVAGLKVYPNPASHQVTLETSDELQFVELYSIGGQLIERMRVAGNSYQINISGIDTGIYLLKVVTHQNTEIVRLKIQ